MKEPFKKQSWKLRSSLRTMLNDARNLFRGEEEFINSLKGNSPSNKIDTQQLLEVTKFQLKLDKLKDQDLSIDVLERAAVIAIKARAKNPQDLFNWATSKWESKAAEEKFFKMWSEVYGHPNHPSECKDQYLIIAAYKSLISKEV